MLGGLWSCSEEDTLEENLNSSFSRKKDIPIAHKDYLENYFIFLDYTNSILNKSENIDLVSLYSNDVNFKTIVDNLHFSANHLLKINDINKEEIYERIHNNEEYLETFNTLIASRIVNSKNQCDNNEGYNSCRNWEAFKASLGIIACSASAEVPPVAVACFALVAANLIDGTEDCWEEHCSET